MASFGAMLDRQGFEAGRGRDQQLQEAVSTRQYSIGIEGCTVGLVV